MRRRPLQRLCWTSAPNLTRNRQVRAKVRCMSRMGALHLRQPGQTSNPFFVQKPLGCSEPSGKTGSGKSPLMRGRNSPRLCCSHSLGLFLLLECSMVFSPCFVGYLSAVPAKADKIKNLLTAPQSSVQTYSCLRRAVRSNQNHAWFAPAQKCILPACPSRDSEHFLHASHALQLRKQECSLIGPSVSQRFVISLHSLLEAKAFSLPPAESVIALITKQASA